ncbi:hypothetical protein ACFLY9_01885 [Patescibacteria group bacterium]
MDIEIGVDVVVYLSEQSVTCGNITLQPQPDIGRSGCVVCYDVCYGREIIGRVSLEVTRDSIIEEITINAPGFGDDVMGGVIYLADMGGISVLRCSTSFDNSAAIDLLMRWGFTSSGYGREGFLFERDLGRSN